MRRWEGTATRDFQAIDRISRYLDEVDAGFRRIQNGQLPSAGGSTIVNTIAGVTSHHLLTDLTTFDDHPQYLYLAGRPTGQDAYGSSSTATNDATQGLRLHSHLGTGVLSQSRLILDGLGDAYIFANNLYIRDNAGSTSGIDILGGSNFVNFQMIGGLSMTGNAAVNVGLTVTNASSSSAAAELLTVQGKNGQTGTLYVSKPTTTSTCHQADYYKPDSTLGSFIDVNGVWNGAVAAGFGAGGWTDDGTVVRLTTATDDVSIGTASDLSAKLGVLAAASAIGTVVKLTSGTADLSQWQNASSGVLLSVGAAGNLVGDSTGAATWQVFDQGGGTGGLKLTSSASAFSATFDTGSLSADANYTLPDGSGSLVSDQGTIQLGNKTLNANNGNFIEVQATTGVKFTAGSTHTKGFNFSAAGISASTFRNFAMLDYSGALALVGSAAAAAAGVLLKVDSTALTAIVGVSNIVAAPLAGMYQVNYAYETTTGTVGDGTVTFQINYADDVGATTQVSAALSLVTTGRVTGVFTFYAVAGTALSYQTNQATGVYTAATTRTALRVRTTYLG